MPRVFRDNNHSVRRLMFQRPKFFRSVATSTSILLLSAAVVLAADSPMTTSPSGPGEITALPTVLVTAQKELTDAQNTPLSVTPVTAATIEDAGILSVKDASIYAPNTVMTEFSARKLSNPRFRGVGASPNNPA